MYELTIDLDATGWQFEPGHRLRLSISNADFPNAWPMPWLAKSVLRHGPARPSRLLLPVAPPPDEALPAPALEPSPFADERGERAPQSWRVSRDLMTGQVEVAIKGGGAARIDGVWLQETSSEAVAVVNERDPARAWVRGRQTVRYDWPGRTIETRSRGQIESDATTFQVTLHVEITMDGLPHFSRRWVRSYPRHLL